VRICSISARKATSPHLLAERRMLVSAVLHAAKSAEQRCAVLRGSDLDVVRKD
jgi:hypothetical protein